MELQEINKKIKRGILTLTFRRLVIYAIRFVAINLVLARFLDPSIIGIFNIANSILAFFGFFSDIGLAAAIIQKKDLAKEDLKTTFTIQILLALIVATTIWFLAPFLANLNHLDLSGMWLIRVLGVGFLLTNLKVLPSVLLERELRFEPLVMVEVLETIVFTSILIFLSFQGWGVNGFSVASLSQSIIGAIAIYLISPWKVTIGINWTSLKSLFKFGIPFQANSLIALLKDRLVPLIIFPIIGSTGVGYVSWAQGFAFMPLEVMNIMIRVTFPAFARIQNDKEAIKSILEKSIFLTTLFLFPMLFGLLFLAPFLIEYGVSNKWRPALPLIYLFSFSTFWAAFSTTFTNVFNAVGKIGITLKLMVMWTILTWILSPLLSFRYGYIGVGIASAIISFTSIIPVLIIKKQFNIEILKSVKEPFVASVLMGLLIYYLADLFVKDLFTLLLVVLLGGIIYGGLIGVLMKEKVIDLLKSFFSSRN